uniref:Uncharacterized protein n=1 Tax=Neobodo designis TaxID=312471 RepID=A0A7S1KYU8_NEODS
MWRPGDAREWARAVGSDVRGLLGSGDVVHCATADVEPNGDVASHVADGYRCNRTIEMDPLTLMGMDRRKAGHGHYLGIAGASNHATARANSNNRTHVIRQSRVASGDTIVHLHGVHEAVGQSDNNEP